MAIDRSGKWWTGDAAEDIEEYLRDFSADGYPVTTVVPATCTACESTTFAVRMDDDEGAAERLCSTCGAAVLLLDSADFIDDAELEEAACPCGGETFNVAIGFALHADGEVRWVYLGLRCTNDGVLGCYADWKIDYSPSTQLLTQV